MDMRSWKKFLLQWIRECGFSERNYFHIEQSDIDGFYQKFYECHTIPGPCPNSQRLGMLAFLQEHYPHFEPHLDDENELSSGDYIYVYSLLLHYSCVKCPRPFFHEICQKLSTQCQQCVASFFKELLDCRNISKEDLRRAIAKVASAHGSPQQNDSSGSNNGDLNSSSVPRVASPMKTPNRASATGQRISPSTPKTFLLEERTRELYNLRAQLETERYEKGLLEVQIKQNEDKILKLNQDHKKLQQQIQDLKNDILTRNAEGDTFSKNDGEDQQTKRRLCKEINQKEQEIAKLMDLSTALKEEKNLIHEKLLYAEKQIIVCMDRIKELDYKVDELTADLEQKNEAIKYLHDRKLELEQFIADTRSASSNSKPDFNTSAECLDMSFSRLTNSSSSVSSPENLGCSVVDVKLREKENENSQLKDQLSAMRANNTRLAKFIQQLCFKLSQEYHIHMENAAINEEEQVDPTEHFLIYADCADRLGKSYKNERNKVRKLQEETHHLQHRNSELSKKVDQFEQEMSTVRHHLQRVEAMNKQLDEEKKEVLEKLKQLEQEIKTISEQKYRLVTQLDTVSNDYDQHKNNCKAHQIDFTMLIEKLQTEVVARNKENTEMNKTNADICKTNVQLKSEVESWQNQFSSLQTKFLLKSAEYEAELQTLTDRMTKQSIELKDNQTSGQVVKEKYEKLLILSEAMKRKTRESDEHLDAMRNLMAIKEMEMSKLGTEINNVRQLNTELEERINTLMNQYKMEKQHSDVTINLRDECIRKIDAEKEGLQYLLQTAQNELENTQQEMKNTSNEIQTISNKVDVMYRLLELPIERSTLSANVEKLVDTIKLIVEQKTDATLKIECLEFNNLECTMKIQEIEEQLQRALLENLENEARMQTFKEEKASSIEKIEKEMQAKEDELIHALCEHESALKVMKSDLKVWQERHANKEHELIVIIEEHNETKKKMKQLQSSNLDKIKGFESKIDKFVTDNCKLKTEVDSFKAEHANTEHRLKETDDALNELADQLNEENTNTDELRGRLKTSEELLIEAEKKLESVLTDNSNTMRDLQATLERQSNKLKSAEEELAALASLKSEQMDVIADLKEDVKKVSDEKARMLADATQFAMQIQQEQSEKSTLLRSLEKTADQLKIAVEDKEQQTALLATRCAALEEKIKEADEKCIQLQAEIAAKTAEICMNFDEHQQERENWHSKISELMRKLTEQSIELEANDIAIIEIMSVLDNNANFLSTETPSEEIKNIFDLEESKMDSIMNQLKKALNRLMSNLVQLHAQRDDAEQKLKANSTEIDSIREEKNALSDLIKQNQTEISELQDMLAGEAKSIESQYAKEVERLNSNVQNLENENEKLIAENASLQVKIAGLEEDAANAKFGIELLNESKNRLTEDQKYKSEIMEKMKQEERKLNESLKDHQAEVEKLQGKSAQMERQLKQKNTKLAAIEKDLKLANEQVTKMEQKVAQTEKQLSSLQSEIKELNEKYRVQHTTNQSLEAQLTHKCRESIDLHSKVAELLTTRQHLEEEFASTSQKLNDTVAMKLSAENKYEQLNSQFQQLIRDYDVSKLQLQSALSDVERLSSEIEAQKNEKLQLGDELKESKRDLQRANDNVSQLIQQIASIRLEKESVIDENQLLRKQLEETGNYRSSSESKLKSIIESSQSMEMKLLSAENELKSIRSHLAKTQGDSEKLSAENKKLRDTHEASQKRTEKIALKLGDSQARSTKLERENEKMTKMLEAKSATVEALQREKDLLQNEVRSLKERFSKSERACEQISAKAQTLEKAHATLQEAKQKLEISDIDGKSKLMKLEKMREANEEKIRKLNNTLNSSEHTNVRLNLEIGALNSQLNELKNTASAEHLGQVEDITKNLTEAKQQAKKFEQLSQKLEEEANELRDKNTEISDQLSKVSISLQISKDKFESLSKEMEDLRIELVTIREQKLQIEQQHADTCLKLKDFGALREQIIADKHETVAGLEAEISNLKAELVSKSAEVELLRNEVDALHTKAADKSQEDDAVARMKIEELRSRLVHAESMLEQEQAITTQLRLDNQILQAKYRESKQRALTDTKASEERIKENRLELEGKLEKMKNKMKTLYTEEITKMKAKQEKETATIKSAMEVLTAQNAKYEEHTRKLSSQIVRLNDRILEEHKQNAILSTKLKHLEEYERQQFKHPSSLHMSTSTLTTTAPSSSTNLGTNLAMEDEEGEVFNNTYLTDLKAGRMSEYMSRDVCTEELRYRNSLLLPHLKSTYAAQYQNHDLAEDELKVSMRNRIKPKATHSTLLLHRRQGKMHPNISRIWHDFMRK